MEYGHSLLMHYRSERSRFAALALAAFAVAGLTCAATAATGSPAKRMSTPVRCDESVEIIPPPSSPSADRRLLFGGRVAINPAWGGPAGPRTGWPGWYWQKEGIWIRTGGSEPLRVVVPKRWRSRVQIRFASGSYSSVTFSNCKPPPAWDIYVGGIFSRGKLCVPLTFELGKARATRTFALQSKPCSG
jgi:hypothetical protein